MPPTKHSQPAVPHLPLHPLVSHQNAPPLSVPPPSLCTSPHTRLFLPPVQMGEVQGQALVMDLNADGAVEIFAGGCRAHRAVMEGEFRIGDLAMGGRGQERGAKEVNSCM